MKQIYEYPTLYLNKKYFEKVILQKKIYKADQQYKNNKKNI